jgi:outer membrane protein TolC
MTLIAALRTAVSAMALVLFPPANTHAAGLPQPLTLEQALALADEPHPDLDQAAARLESARAALTQAESVSGWRAHADLTPQSVLPALRTDDRMVDDSRARLFVSKPLYDFGRSAALEGSARAEIEAREQTLLDARQSRRLDIMRRFLEVLSSDLRYAADNEMLAHLYVNFDKSRKRRELGQISDVDLLELESRYQDSLIVRTRSQKRQAQTRQQLALALNRPDDLPAEVTLPKFPGNDRDSPEFKAVYDKARTGNPALAGLRREAEAAQKRVSAERARRYPVLSAEGEAAWYARDFVSRDDLRATLNLRVPLWQGGEDSAAIGQALAREHELEARLARAEFDLRQTVLDLVQEIESLRVERNAARVRSAWRDLYLDRSRALYEQEVKTDLGDAMARLTEAQWQAAQVEFRLAMAWARLDALSGELLAHSQPESIK